MIEFLVILQAMNSVDYNLVILKKKKKKFSEQIQGDSFSINCCSDKNKKRNCLVLDENVVIY